MEALAADSVLVVQVAAEVLRRIASTLHPRAVLVVVVLGSSITQEHLVYLDKETLVVQDETIVVTIQAAVAAVKVPLDKVVLVQQVETVETVPLGLTVLTTPAVAAEVLRDTDQVLTTLVVPAVADTEERALTDPQALEQHIPAEAAVEIWEPLAQVVQA